MDNHFTNLKQIKQAVVAFEQYASLPPGQAERMEGMMLRLARWLDSQDTALRPLFPVRWAMAFVCYLNIAAPVGMYYHIGDNRLEPKRAVRFFARRFSDLDRNGNQLCAYWLALAVFMGLLGHDEQGNRLSLAKAYPEFHTDFPELAKATSEFLGKFPDNPDWRFEGMPDSYYDGMLRSVFGEIKAKRQAIRSQESDHRKHTPEQLAKAADGLRKWQAECMPARPKNGRKRAKLTLDEAKRAMEGLRELHKEVFPEKHDSSQTHKVKAVKVPRTADVAK